MGELWAWTQRDELKELQHAEGEEARWEKGDGEEEEDALHLLETGLVKEEEVPVVQTYFASSVVVEGLAYLVGGGFEGYFGEAADWGYLVEDFEDFVEDENAADCWEEVEVHECCLVARQSHFSGEP